MAWPRGGLKTHKIFSLWPLLQWYHKKMKFDDLLSSTSYFYASLFFDFLWQHLSIWVHCLADSQIYQGFLPIFGGKCLAREPWAHSGELDVDRLARLQQAALLLQPALSHHILRKVMVDGHVAFMAILRWQAMISLLWWDSPFYKWGLSWPQGWRASAVVSNSDGAARPNKQIILCWTLSHSSLIIRKTLQASGNLT